jgi:Tfp pilus assembly protein PilN
MIRINLAPSEARKPAFGLPIAMPGANLGVALGVLYGVAVLGLGGYYIGLSREAARLEQEVELGTRELGTLKATLGNVEKVREQLAELTKRVQTVQDLAKNQGMPIRVMDAFADVLPRDLWITTLEERGPELRAAGAAFSATAVADFMTNLRSSGKFKEVDVVISKQDLSKVSSPVTFEVTCRYAI